MKPTRLLFLAPPGRASPWLMISPEGHILQRGSLQDGDPVPGDPEAATVVAVPSADVLIRWVRAPGRTEAQSRAAALFALTDILATPAEESILVLGRQEEGDGLRLAAVVANTTLGRWLDRVRDLGLEPDLLCPDVLLLPPPADDEVLTGARFGESLALRGRRFAFSGEPDLVELMAAGRPAHMLESSEILDAALATGALAPPVNLVRSAASATDPRRWRRAGVLAALVLMSPILLTAAAAVRDDWAARRMTAEAAALARETWPNIKGANPVEIARSASTSPPGGVAPAAAALFAAIEQVEGAELDALNFDDAGLQATLSHVAYQDVEALKTAMANMGLSLTALSTENDGERIVSEIRIGAAR